MVAVIIQGTSLLLYHSSWNFCSHWFLSSIVSINRLQLWGTKAERTPLPNCNSNPGLLLGLKNMLGMIVVSSLSEDSWYVKGAVVHCTLDIIADSQKREKIHYHESCKVMSSISEYFSPKFLWTMEKKRGIVFSFMLHKPNLSWYYWRRDRWPVFRCPRRSKCYHCKSFRNTIQVGKLNQDLEGWQNSCL